MCGIAGQVVFKGKINEESIHSMNNALKHRGPDGSGVYVSRGENVGLGHRRLSFLDLSEAGKQPMCNEDGTMWLSYNGEIYNYIELREYLEQRGHVFSSHTDSEVILHGYEEWGTEVLSRLKGMFAIAIWDEMKQELFLARDRFGIKPLFYYYDESKTNFVFASEIKGIKANPTVSTTVNYSSFADFFVYRYIPSPATIWNNISKLPPATFMILTRDGELRINKYWEIPFAENVITDKEAVEKFDQLLYDSVHIHARSDVPVGSFLSGGYDSSALVYYMSRFGYVPETFAIGFEGWDVSEHLYAEMVANKFNTKHHSLVLESQSLDILDHLSWVYDEPNGDISIIPTYLVSKEAAKSVKAVMSGEGSDEILMGYQWQKDYKPLAVQGIAKWLGMKNMLTRKHILSYYAHCMSMGRFDSTELHSLLHPDLHGHIKHNVEWFYRDIYRADLPDVKAIQWFDIRHFMGEQVLVKMDRASMANSLEVRVPFLDHEICEFVMSLSPDVYYKTYETKHLLYQNLKGHLPDEILDRRKQGFVGPDLYYMNYDWYEKRLRESKLVEDKLINSAYLDKLFKNKDHWRLWKVAVMEAWYRRWN